MRRITEEEFIERAIDRWEGAYTYPYGFEGMRKKFSYHCPKHGRRDIATAAAHLYSPCIKCSHDKQAYSIEQLQEAAHNVTVIPEYDRSGKHKTVKIYCEHHGESWVKVNTLMKGKGCKRCALSRTSPWKLDKQEIIKRAEDNGYIPDPKSIRKRNNKHEIKVTCHIHNYTTWATVSNLGNGSGCSKCAHKTSEGQEYITQLIQEYGYEVMSNTWKILPRCEVDIYIPELKTAIEYNGIYWHSSLIDPNKHKQLKKTEKADKLGIRLIHIWEDEYHKYRHRLDHFLSYLCAQHKTVYARDCECINVSPEDARFFYDNYHMQGFVGAEMHIGLLYNKELVAMMSFSKVKRNGALRNEEADELVRYASKYRIVGGASKLLHRFEITEKPNKVVSFAERRLFNGNLYRQLGFTLDGVTPPDYSVVYKGTRYHRQWAQKSRLARRFPDKFNHDKTEYENCHHIGIGRLYGCGNMRFIKQYN